MKNKNKNKKKSKKKIAHHFCRGGGKEEEEKEEEKQLRNTSVALPPDWHMTAQLLKTEFVVLPKHESGAQQKNAPFFSQKGRSQTSRLIKHLQDEAMKH